MAKTAYVIARPKIDGKKADCNEYPFAATYQGAFTALRQSGESMYGSARTFKNCRIEPPIMTVWPGGTNPNGFSRCFVPNDQNRSEGGTRSAFYRAQRMLDGDPFFVGL